MIKLNFRKLTILTQIIEQIVKIEVVAKKKQKKICFDRIVASTIKNKTQTCGDQCSILRSIRGSKCE